MKLGPGEVAGFVLWTRNPRPAHGCVCRYAVDDHATAARRIKACDPEAESPGALRASPLEAYL